MSGTPIDFQSISHAMSALLNLIFCFIFFKLWTIHEKKKNTYIHVYALQISFTVIKIAEPKTANNGMTN